MDRELHKWTEVLFVDWRIRQVVDIEFYVQCADVKAWAVVQNTCGMQQFNPEAAGLTSFTAQPFKCVVCFVALSVSGCNVC